MNINDNKRLLIQFDSKFQKELYLNGSWELVNDSFQPINSMNTDQLARIDILAHRNDSSSEPVSGKLSFMLVGHSIENKTFLGQIGSTATVDFSATDSMPIDYDLTIEIPAHKLAEGSYEIMLLTTFYSSHNQLEIAGVSDKRIMHVTTAN